MERKKNIYVLILPHSNKKSYDNNIKTKLPLTTICI